jgi:hypothetical protein
MREALVLSQSEATLAHVKVRELNERVQLLE